MCNNEWSKSDTFKIIHLNAVGEGNLEAISPFVYGSDHVIPKQIVCS